MSLHSGEEHEYLRRHQPIWPEMEAMLKAHGAHNYSIFFHPQTGQLFAYVEVENEEHWAAAAKTEVCARWWNYMKDIMPSNVDGSPIGHGLSEVFHLA